MRTLILKASLALALGAGVAALIPASAEALSCTSGYAHIFNHNNLYLDNSGVQNVVIGEFGDIPNLTNYCYESGWIVQARTNLCLYWGSSTDIYENTCNTSSPRQVWTKYGTPWANYYRLENLYSKTCLSGNGLVHNVITVSCSNVYKEVWTS